MKSTSQPEPTALCAAFAALLPILNEPGVDAEDAAQARTHLATCAYCQAEIAAYDQLDAAVRQTWGPMGTARYRTEELLRPIFTGQTDEPRPLRSDAAARHAATLAGAGKPRRWQGWFSAVAVALILVVLSGVIFSLHRLETQNAPGGGNSSLHRVADTELDAISMVSPTDGWAAGVAYGDVTTYQPNTPVIDHPADHVLLAHYVGGNWVPVNLAIAGQLESISMDSATDGWAVGESYFGAPTGGIILHYNGQAWSRAAFPDQSTILSQIQMLSATDGWAIGTTGQNNTASLWHYDGQVWTRQALPASLTNNGQNSFAINSISMLSATEGWMIGALAPAATPSSGPNDPFQSQTGVILHFEGGRWAVQQTFPGTLAGSISFDAATDGWATLNKLARRSGLPTPGTLPFQSTPILLHYQHGAWVNATTTIRAEGQQVQSLGGVTMDSATNGWIRVGLRQGTPEDPDLLLHYNGSGWSVVSVPTVKNGFVTIAGIAMTSTTEGWAVGNIAVYDTGGYDQLNTPLILHYQNGVWSIFER